MSDTDRNEILRDVFRLAAASSATEPPPDDTSHPANDDELLIRWSLDELEEAEHERIVEHLAECPYCRREISAMIRAGAVVLPEQEDVAFAPDAPVPAAAVRRAEPGTSSRRNMLLAVTALAASLLIAIVWSLSGGDPDGSSIVAMAQRDLQEGRPAAAFDRIEEYLGENQSLADGDRAAAGRILEQSGYQLARTGLENGQFRSVLDIEGQAARHSAVSPRLANLRIQAERGVPGEQTLTTKGALTDYDYELDGLQYAKGVPSFDATTARLEKEFAEAVKSHPDSLDLHLNFGQFLMEQNEFEQAAEQFAVAVRLDPTSTLAQTGLGLALFQQDTDATIGQALGRFQEAVELSPSNFAANLNLAVCLTRLGRKEEARSYFQKAHTLTGDEDAKRRIEKTLEEE